MPVTSPGDVCSEPTTYERLQTLGLFVQHDFISLTERRALRSIVATGTRRPLRPTRLGRTVHDPEVPSSWWVDIGTEWQARVAERLRSAAARLTTGAHTHDISDLHALRYETADFLPPHRDNSIHSDDTPAILARRFTAIVFLDSWNGWHDSEGTYDGGLLKLYERRAIRGVSGCDSVAVAGRAGTLIVHNAGVVHEVTAITAGTRCSLVAWFV
jgi:hypothetical protein